jgi:hypothetical protein
VLLTVLLSGQSQYCKILIGKYLSEIRHERNNISTDKLMQVQKLSYCIKYKVDNVLGQISAAVELHARASCVKISTKINALSDCSYRVLWDIYMFRLI